MTIDFSSPFDFLKTMRLNDYEYPDDFFCDMHEQLDLDELEDLREENQKLKAQLEKAESVLEALIMENEHADFCHFKTGQLCRCMDRGVYNLNVIRINAREYFNQKDAR